MRDHIEPKKELGHSDTKEEAARQREERRAKHAKDDEARTEAESVVAEVATTGQGKDDCETCP